jgi:hypothetical protein
MDSSSLEAAFGITMPRMQEQIEELKGDYAKAS